MVCRKIDLGNGATAIVCSRGQRERCNCGSGKPVSRLCDFELGGRKAGKTCSAKLCDSCSSSVVGSDGDYCSAHARLLEQRAAWRTVAEMAAAWGASERDVEQALLLTGVRDSTAHAAGTGSARRWSPQAQGLVKVELRSRT